MTGTNILVFKIFLILVFIHYFANHFSISFYSFQSHLNFNIYIIRHYSFGFSLDLVFQSFQF